MLRSLLALNPLSSTDIIFFVVLGVLVVLCIVAYFLIPVINKKQYQEMRDNLKKREAAFQSNVKRTDGSPSVVAGLPEEFSDEPAAEAQDPTEQSGGADEK